jgi:hypothetical protein
MVAAIGFACIRCSGVLVRRVEFTAEVQECLPFLRFAGLGHEPLDSAGFHEAGTGSGGTEQHFHLTYAATASIMLPPLAYLRYASTGEFADPAIYLQAFGVCVEEPGRRTDCLAGLHDWIQRAPDRLGSVVDHVVRDRDFDIDTNSPFRFAWDPFDSSGNRGSLEGVADVKIVSTRKVRALLLVEPPSFGNTCHLRLYTETDRPRLPSRYAESNGRVFANRR